MKNARIWIWENGAPIKLTLKPGVPLRWTHGGRDEEGWSWTRLTFEWDGHTLLQSYDFDGRDCDGRLTRSGACCTTPDLFQAGHQEETDPAVRYPKWEELSQSQRDYTAEAAGY
jgi:hypothetical protein